MPGTTVEPGPTVGVGVVTAATVGVDDPTHDMQCIYTYLIYAMYIHVPDKYSRETFLPR